MEFRFLVTEDTKCHSCIFSIFLNLSLPLVICIAKAILANRHDAKWKKEVCTMNKWNRFWKIMHQLSCALPYIICILHWFLWHAVKYSCRLFGWTETCILPGFHGNLFLELGATANVSHYNIPWEFKLNVISRHGNRNHFIISEIGDIWITMLLIYNKNVCCKSLQRS